MNDLKGDDVGTKELSVKYNKVPEKEIYFFFANEQTGKLRLEISTTTRYLACT